LLLLSGNWEEGREIIKSADLLFQQGFRIAQKNVTISGEKAYVDEIEKAYRVFKDLWARPIVGTKQERNLNWYFQEVHPSFLDVKLAVKRLMALNNKVMYQTASDLKNRAHSAVMPGIVAILSALIFTLIFNYFVNYYLVSPIIKITKEIQKCLKTSEPFQVRIETKDELHHLASALQELVEQSRKHEAV
jgi:methyl-accepting chemotaxis protein